jgi:hypothetical protein
MEILAEVREEALAAMKGKVPLDRVSGLPRERLGAMAQRQHTDWEDR